jgi:hypothetical protein
MDIPVVDGKIDSYVRGCFKANKNTSVSWFLICSYCYYIRHSALISDTMFDGMCKWMLDNYESLEHVNLTMVDKGMLQAGTAFNLKREDYPMRVQVVGETLIKLVNQGRGQE